MRYILFSILTLFFLNAFAQERDNNSDYIKENLIIKNVTLSQGLASNAVLKISKTAKGYLFLATYNGISLYDGKKCFNFNSENNTAISSNSIYDFCFGKDSSIWVATQKGISIYKNFYFYKNKNLKSLDNLSIVKILCDKKGVFWIATMNHGLFQFANNKLKKVEGIASVEHNIISLLYEDNFGNIWIGTERGSLYQYIDNNFKLIYKPKIINEIFVAFQNKEGKYFFGTHQGLYTLNNNKFEILNKNINFINDIKEDRNGNLWFATNSGIYYYTEHSNSFIRIKQLQYLHNQIIQNLYFDKDNILWIGTYRKGLVELRTGAFVNFPFKNANIDDTPSCISVINNKEIWISTDEGIIYKISQGKLQKIKLESKLKGSRIKKIYQDKNKNIWICSYNGLVRIKDGHEIVLGGSTDFPDKTFRNIIQDSNGDYWAGTRQSGIYHFNKNLKLINRFNTDNGLANNFTMDLLKGKNGKIYVANKRGLDIIQNNKLIKHIGQEQGLADDMIFSIYQDNEDILWISTINGLSRIENNSIKNFNTSNGFLSNKIYDVTEDKYHNFWIAISNGLMKIRKKDLNIAAKDSLKKFTVSFFDEADGIYDAHFVAVTKMYKTENDNIYFCTSSGVSMLKPEIIKSIKSNPKLIIHSLHTSKKTYGKEENLKLKSDTKYISISFSIINFLNPGKSTVEYKLEPFEQNWIKTSKNSVNYTNLSPGSYLFKIRINPIETGGKKIFDELKFTIIPKFYQTVYFKILSIAIIIIIVLLVYRLRLSQLKKYQNKLQTKIQSRTKEIRKANQELEKSKNEILTKNEEILLQRANLEQAFINLRILSELGREITSHITIKEITFAVYHHIVNLMDTSIFAIGIINKIDNTLIISALIDNDKYIPSLITKLNTKECLLSQSYAKNKEILINDVTTELDKSIKSFPKMKRIRQIASAIVIPVKIKNELLGVITTQSERKHAYSDYHFNFLSNLATYVGIALENAENFKKIEQQKSELENLNNAKDRMFSIIGHDLRGPVGTIKSFLDLIIDNPEMTDSNQTIKILKTMQQSLGSAYNLLDNLLLWARAQRGTLIFEPEQFFVTNPIDESINLIKELADNKNIKITKKTEYSGLVYGDRNMITTVIRNLLSNAIKFTPNSGQIVISSKLKLIKENNHQTEKVEISIIDTGIGIKEDTIKEILDSNNSYSTIGTNKEKGSGLGISICVEFLNKHDEKLSIVNNKSEKGSTFSFQLPVN